MLMPDMLELLRAYAPESLALANDPVGLLIDPAQQEITGVVVCLDSTPYVAEQARARQAQLIVAHHPLIYHPLRRLSADEPISAVVLSLAQSGTGLYAMHTNWDAAQGGINDTLANRLGLIDARPLGPHKEAALARIGKLPQPLRAPQLLQSLQAALGDVPTSAIRIPRRVDAELLIETVAVCGGAGSGLSEMALQSGAQAFVTADVRHHEFVEAGARGFLLIDAGHEATEAPGMQALAERLKQDAPGVDVSFVPNWPS